MKRNNCSQVDDKKRGAFELRAFLLGVISSLAQVALVRELLTAFYGNEVAYVLVLLLWLAGNALGAWSAGRRRGSATVFLVGAVLLLPASIVLIRLFRIILGLAMGEDVGPAFVCVAAVVAIVPVSILLGACFTALVRAGKTAVRVYTFEAAGFLAGGLLSVIWLPMVMGFLDAGPLHFTRELQWPGYHLVATQESPYGNIVLLEKGGAYSMFENGQRMFTTGDVLFSEERVHFALLSHSAPRRVLLIGSGMGGALEEVLKYPEVMVDDAELDPAAVDMGRRYIPGVGRALSDARIRVVSGDARALVRRMHGQYDVIIAGSMPPLSLLANRYYTVEFFKEAFEALRPDGVLSFSAPASENYLNSEAKRVLRGLYTTAKGVFPEVKVLPGDQYIFLAGKLPGTVTDRADVLAVRLKARAIRTKFVQEYYVASRLSPDRMANVSALVDVPGEVNTDLRPAGFMAAVAYQATHASDMVPKVFDIFKAWGWVVFLIPVFAAGGMLMARSGSKLPVGTVMVAAGFVGIALQIAALFVYQAKVGYSYMAVGIFSALFMGGAVLGSRVGRWSDQGLLSCVRGLCFSGGIFAWILLLHPDGGMASWACFTASLAAGLSTGAFFSWALSVTKEGFAGTLYALDLSGAVLGTLCTGIFILPIWGVEGLALLCVWIAACLAAGFYPSRESADL
ncbi:MAG: hypothetical protein HQL19_01200 [Candidatus Omnitrophica bacterium]|nr:hypothetical protein [Candidatus Omnitrophota bacterium]